MRTKEINIYKFEELSDTIKTKIIENWHERENDELKIEMDYYVSELPQYLSNVIVAYCFGYSQGDGVSFSADFDLEEYCIYKKIKMKTSVYNVINTNYQIAFRGNTGRHTYARADQVSLSWYHGKACKRLEAYLVGLRDEIASDYMEMCKTLEKKGYRHLEYRMSFTEFAEFSENNGYEYLEDGELVSDF